MNAAYVGILQPGSTSRMRAECLRALTPEWNWEWIDTDPPMQASARFWRTLAFRSQRGKAVDRINHVVMAGVGDGRRDLVWIDKAVFLRPSTLQAIRSRTRRLVHFTPDTAFHSNRSRHFESAIGLYDLVVTTKSFEVGEYERRVGAGKTFLTTQGYDAAVHYPLTADAERKREAVFVGLAEPDRELCIATLLSAGVPVRLAGHGWQSFLRKWRANPLLAFEGEEIFGVDYARVISSSWIGLGLLSKRFPEMHTTRTFEIPACGTVLATERTPETSQFFKPEEALFFDGYTDLAHQAKALLRPENQSLLSGMAAAGRRRVMADGRDNGSIIAAILADPRLGL